MAQLWKSILQDHRGNAVLVEPLRDGIALAISDVPNVATTGTKHDGDTVGLVGRRQEHFEFQAAILKSAVAKGRLVGPEGHALGWYGLNRFGRIMSKSGQ